LTGERYLAQKDINKETAVLSKDIVSLSEPEDAEVQINSS